MSVAVSVSELPLPPQLTPRTHPWIEELIKDLRGSQYVLGALPSPFHVWNPRVIEENVRDLEAPLSSRAIRSRIYFSRKANRDSRFVNQAAALGLSIDVASFQEFQASLHSGIEGPRILITAATKPKALFELAANVGATVVLDNLDEIEVVRALAAPAIRSLRIWLRISGFELSGSRLYSRFGFTESEAECVGVQLQALGVRVSGLQTHLAKYDPRHRIRAAQALFELAEKLKTSGHAITSIDLGGGIPVNYLQSEQQWRDFHRAFDDAVLGNRPELTFRGDGLGRIAHEGKIIGEGAWYPFYQPRPKGAFIEDIISAPELVSRLSAFDGELCFEPGRALLDLCGVTCARVAFRKRDSEGRILVGLEMNTTQLKSSSSDFLVDPLEVFTSGKESDNVGVYFVGTYCNENELILKRRIRLSRLPQVGEWVCFPNTAGYVSHLFEAQGHLAGLAPAFLFEELRAKIVLSAERSAR